MNSLQRQGLAVSIGIFLSLFFPVSASAVELVGVARAAGPAQLNGVSFPGEVNVFSGDRVSTGRQGTLVVSSGPRERVRLAAGTDARITKQDGRVAVSLLKGIVGFESAGRTQVTLEQYGVTIRGKDGRPAIGQVMLVGSRKAEVIVFKGAVELSGPQQTVFLREGDLGLIAANNLQDPPTETTEGAASSETEQATGSLRLSVVDNRLFAVPGASVVFTNEQDPTLTYRAVSNQLGEVRIEGVRPGFYRLEIQKSGFGLQRLGPIEVIPNEETGLGTVKIGGGGDSKTAAIVILAIAGAGGAGAAVALTGGDNPPISPSSP